MAARRSPSTSTWCGGRRCSARSRRWRPGTTAIVDHHASPTAIDGSLDVIAEACAEVGVRVRVRLRGHRPPRARRAPRPGWPRTSGSSGPAAGAWSGPTPPSPCRTRRWTRSSGLAADLGVGVHIHVGEDAADAGAGRPPAPAGRRRLAAGPLRPRRPAAAGHDRPQPPVEPEQRRSATPARPAWPTPGTGSCSAATASGPPWSTSSPWPTWPSGPTTSPPRPTRRGRWLQAGADLVPEVRGDEVTWARRPGRPVVPGLHARGAGRAGGGRRRGRGRRGRVHPGRRRADPGPGLGGGAAAVVEAVTGGPLEPAPQERGHARRRPGRGADGALRAGRPPDPGGDGVRASGPRTLGLRGRVAGRQPARARGDRAHGRVRGHDRAHRRRVGRHRRVDPQPGPAGVAVLDPRRPGPGPGPGRAGRLVGPAGRQGRHRPRPAAAGHARGGRGACGRCCAATGRSPTTAPTSTSTASSSTTSTRSGGPRTCRSTSAPPACR